MNVATGYFERIAPFGAEFRLRITVAILGVLAATVGCLGLTAEIAFSQPSTFKYAITVLGPVVVVVLAASRNPLRLLLALAILTAPFDLTVAFQGLTLTPLAVCGGAAVVLLS